jgi:urease alpha subunit
VLTEGTPQHRRIIMEATERARTAMEKAEAKGDQVSAAAIRREVRIGEETLRLHEEYNATGKPTLLNE